VFTSDWLPRLAIDGNVNTAWNAGDWATTSNPYWLARPSAPVPGQRDFLRDIVWSGGPFLGFNKIYNLYIGNDA